MKEIHKILEMKTDLALKALGYEKNGPVKWYLPMNGFSRAVEIQRSQWSDAIYINMYIYIGNEKPKPSAPYLMTRLAGADLNIKDEDFNEALNLAEGDPFEKTNLVAQYVVEGLKRTLDNIQSVEDARFWLQNKSLEKGGQFRFAHTSGDNAYTALEISISDDK